MRFMYVFCVVALMSQAAVAETVLIEFEIPGREPSVHRLFYDTDQPEVAASGFGFWRLGSPTTHMFSDRSGESAYDPRYSGETYHLSAVRMWRMSAKGYTLMDFRATEGASGPSDTTPAFMMRFNELLDELPGVEKLKEGVVLPTRCDGVQLFSQSWIDRRGPCSDVEKIPVTGVNFMSLDPVLDLYPTGDINRDFKVGFDDFLARSANFGAAPEFITGPVATTATATLSESVPEPSSWTLLGLTLTGACWWRRRRLM